MFRAGRGEIDAARRLCVRLLAWPEKFGDAGLKIQAHHAMWSTSFVCGEPAKARAHARSGLALFNPEIHESMASSYGNHDAACCARYFSAMALALAGDGEGARAMIEQALAAARASMIRSSLALTLYFTSAAAQMLGDVPLATANSELSVRMATEYDLAQPKAWSMGVAGWCIAENGDPDRGIALATQAIAAMQAIQSRHFLCYLLGLLADACTQGRAGRRGDESSRGRPRPGRSHRRAILQRRAASAAWRAVGASAARPEAKAEASFRAAIKVAKQQGAAALERKAIESLRRWSR